MMQRIPYEPLTGREREILTLLSQNLSDREIADRLFVAYTTVKWYNRQIYAKLGVENRQEAVRRAAAMGLLDSSGPKPTPKHNLPSALTPFIGRSTELADLCRLLSQPHTRLVTILAPGGMGKTRLALETAAAMLDLYADGVYFVALAGLTSSDHFVSATAEALGLQFAPDGRTPQQQLSDFLRRKHLLLLLDNFEHLLDSAPLVSELMVAAPNVKALVTSREKLNLSGETVYALVGLQYPDSTDDEPLRYGAVQLFVECALRANAHYRADDTANMGRICRSAQGMSLAIELAAALAGSFSVAEIAAEIERSADFLQTPMRDMPERQRSIRAVFEAAWTRLDEDARRAFRRMSVFRGGCTREAAQTVTGASLATLAALVDKALLRRNPHTERYEIHELLRQYAEGELEKAGESESAQQAHQEYYAVLTENWCFWIMNGKQLEAYAVFDADFENIRPAFARASLRGIADEVKPFTDIIWYFDKLGLWTEALVAYKFAAGRLEPNDSAALARLLTGQAMVYLRLNMEERLYDLGKRAVDMLQRLGANQAMPFAMLVVVLGQFWTSDWQESERILYAAMLIAQENNDPSMVAFLFHYLGVISDYRKKDPQEAKERFAEALRRFSQINNYWGMCHSLRWLGRLASNAEDIDESERWYTECLKLSKTIGFHLHFESALIGLCGAAQLRSDWAALRGLAIEVLSRRTLRGLPDHQLLDPVLLLIEAAAMLDDPDEARRRLRESIPLLSERAVAMNFGWWLLAAGFYLVLVGEFGCAAVFLSWPHQNWDPNKFLTWDLDRLAGLLAACRAALTPEVFDAAVARGKTLTPEAAVAELMLFL